MLAINNLNVVYRNGVKAIREVSLSLEEGKIYGVLGPSGGGKTSFLKGILQLVPSTGKIRFRNKPINSFAKKIAYVEQKENIDRDFPLSVFQCVLLGTYPGLGLFKRPKAREKEMAVKALKDVNMWRFRSRQIGALSGGQFQRVMIARALVQNATLIFLDEPFVGIDVNNEATLIRLLKRMAAKGITIFIVNHDLSKVSNYFDHVIMINEKVIASGPTKETFTQNNLAKTYKMLTQPEDTLHSLSEVG